MAESVVQIVALAEDLINGVDQFIVIEAFELGFVDIEILGNAEHLCAETGNSWRGCFI